MILSEYLNIINFRLKNIFEEIFPYKLYAAVKHLLINEGKRLRALLTLLTYNYFREDIERCINLALSIELIHTASLIHDDIIDKGEYRRNVPTVNKIYGEDFAIIAGDLIFAKAFQLAGSYENRRIIDNIYKMCKELAEGQSIELLKSGNLNISEEVYLEIVKRKTASMFKYALKLASILAGARNSEIYIFERIGKFLGIAYQIIDDILDVSGKFIGKDSMKDLRFLRPNIVLIYTYSKLNEDEKKRFMKELRNGNFSKILHYIKKYNSMEYAKERAEKFILYSLKYIKLLKKEPMRKKFEDIARFIITREY